jgi:argininosuccinate lyase
VTRLASRVAAGLRLDAARAAAAAREGFTAAADVADVVAQRAGLDYRSAHSVVGRAVRDLAEAGLPPEALTPDRLAAAARAAIGRDVAVPADALAAALDPAAALTVRPQVGSASAVEVDAMLEGCQAAIGAGRRWGEGARERRRQAEQALRAATAALAAAPGGGSPSPA